MGKRTPLYEKHRQANAKIVDFAGWDMPVHYGSQLNEHHQVRRDAGLFDVSHMTVLDLDGADSAAFLGRLLANDPARLREPGKALYSCMLNHQGGIIDDLIVYSRPSGLWRLVVNAGTRDKDLAWIQHQAEAFNVRVTEREDLAMLAVQGPNARERAQPLLPEALREPAAALKPFYAVEDGEWFVARTGYTGEDGLEIMLPAAEAEAFWDVLLAAKVRPIGLGARDTLRLEAGMCLYGTDMDENITPYEAGLGWTVAWEPIGRNFIGRSALAGQHTKGPEVTLKGLVLEEKGVLRSHQKIYGGDTAVGETTSGTFSPTLNMAIALARLPVGLEGEVQADIRGKRIAARIVKLPFVRHGQSCL